MTYTAITIGPIFKTIQQARSTKALWAASYLFSWLMRALIRELKLDNSEVILPYFEKTDLEKEEKLGVGLFPDRLIIKKKIEDISGTIDIIKNRFATKICADLKTKSMLGIYQNLTCTEVEDFIRQYLNIRYIHSELNADDNVIFTINKLLDTAELMQFPVEKTDVDYLTDFLENIYYNFLIEEEFDQQNKRFPSTVEIGHAEFREIDEKLFFGFVKGLFKKDDAKSQLSFVQKIAEDESFGMFKRNYRKYIAVVQADGDNIGSFIEKLHEHKDSDTLIPEFSKNLFLFAKDAVKCIVGYKGTPIYAGGDDLLFVCPVAHTNIENGNIKKSILTLIDEIDMVFKTYFTKDSEFSTIIDEMSDKKPSMSYGVAISYYKHPLSEALENGASLLFDKAKKTLKKNAVSYSVMKHSGQFYGTTFHKDNDSYNNFLKLLGKQVLNDDYINSIAQKIGPQKGTLSAIALIDDEDKRGDAMHNFFLNNFDESVHRDKDDSKALNEFLKNVYQLFKSCFDELYPFEDQDGIAFDQKQKNESIDKALDKIYAALRFKEFLHNKEVR